MPAICVRWIQLLVTGIIVLLTSVRMTMIYVHNAMESQNMSIKWKKLSSHLSITIFSDMIESREKAEGLICATNIFL